MSAQSLQVVTVVVPNPDPNGAMFQADSSISFSTLISSNISTLSTTGASSSTNLGGYLYVPDLAASNPCVKASAPYVPSNVTRFANLPPGSNELVGIAPWISTNCTLSYLEAAKSQYVDALVFFIPNNGSGAPPPSSSPIYDLGDGGHWKSSFDYPVYVISSLSGAGLMTASADYSGNMTQVPYGHQLTESFDSRDYVRLLVQIDIGGLGTLPSLWIFLLAVFGILLAVVGITSLVMHLILRRRRQQLRRRVANGEVDLEALGIQRLTVPQEVLAQMPLIAYALPPSEADTSSSGATIEDEKLEKGMSPSQTMSTATGQTSPGVAPHPVRRHAPFLQQPTCAICLEDFVAATPLHPGTVVRELPCRHIFHPECVDTFLRCSSSLCPMCKKSTLPEGYCPRVVTNAMVRRERLVRQIRERVILDAAGDQGVATRSWWPFQSRNRSHPLRWNPPRGVAAANADAAGPAADSVEFIPIEPIPRPVADEDVVGAAAPPAPSSSPPPVPPPASPARREWARQRALAMLGRVAPLDASAQEAQTSTRWQKLYRGVFPGFRS